MVLPAVQVVPGARLMTRLPAGWLVPLVPMAGAVAAVTAEPAPAAAPAVPASPNTERKLKAIVPAAHAVTARRNLLGPCFISCSLDLVFIAIVVTSGLRSPERTTLYI